LQRRTPPLAPYFPLRLPLRAVPAPVVENRDIFWRSLQALSVTRVVIAGVLLTYLGFNPRKGFWLAGQFIYRETGLVYFLLAIVFALLTLYHRRRFLFNLSSQIVTDVVAISLLYAAAGGAKSGLAILYLFPLAGAAILAPLVLALFFVSLATLFLLLESWYQVLNLDAEASTLQAGLYSAAFFVAVFVLNRLAVRLIKQEELALQRGKDLQIQEAINRLVIADMGDGIMVVGPDCTVYACNPATEQMLGLSLDDKPRCRLTEIAALRPIAEAYLGWAAQTAGDSGTALAESTTFVIVKTGDEIMPASTAALPTARRELVAYLKLRFATIEAAAMDEQRAVIFLQDVTEIENKAQQLKLASMGRLTASIAHEVRNPLAAIAHAAALLEEDQASPTHARLLKIVGDNVARVNRMIEDILKLSRKAQLHGVAISVPQLLAEILAEFQEAHALPAGMIELVAGPEHFVQFDPLHLREVVLNLLTNAIRYASGRPGSIRLQLLAEGANRLELHVRDDGRSMTPEVRAHLFEPFYTTSSKGTGLGLYMARELCLNNGAVLDYEFRKDAADIGSDEAQGRFVITFAVAGTQ
jgi:two-component system, NtrC family, sensor histidine kinase PilS